MQHRVPLGLMLQARGVLTGHELQDALRIQAQTGHRLGDVLQTNFRVPEELITGTIAAQWGLDMLHVPLSLATPILNVAPSRLFQASGCFPVERTATSLLLACSEGPDPSLALALERMHPLRVEFGLVSSTALAQWRALQPEDGSGVQCVRSENREAMAAEASELLYRLQPVDSRLVRVNGMWWMRVWLEEAARIDDPSSDSSDTIDVLFSFA